MNIRQNLITHSTAFGRRTLLPVLACAWLAAAAPAFAEITYVDAAHGPAGNTFATGQPPSDTTWLDFTSGSPNANQTQWILRELGTNGTVYQALHSVPPNDLPALTTEITGLADGSYDVWVFFWDGPNANVWTISAGLESGNLTTYSFDGPGNTASPVSASTLAFTNPPPMLTEDPRILYGVKIGQAAVVGGNSIPVYIHNLVGGGSNTRTWYDGVGYAQSDSIPVTGWIDRLGGSTGMMLGDSETNAPIMGDGSPNNANAQSIYAAIPEVSLDELGENIALTGSATLSGIASLGNQFRIGLFDSNGSGDDTGWLGYSQAAGAGTVGGNFWERNAGNTSWYYSTASSAATILASSDAPGTALTDGTYPFRLTIERVAGGLQINATITRLSDFHVFASTSILDPIISTSTFNHVGFLSGNNMNADQIRFSDITVTVNGDLSQPPPPQPPPARLGPPLVGIDFNRTDTFSSPSQSFFRVVGGSATQVDNAVSYTKNFGPRAVTISQPDGEKFEFRGGNGDASRAIPGGETSLSFLVADFIATRKGAIDLEFAGLAAGDYIFRSWHLDTLTSGNLGFAQGATTTTPNTIEARIGGDLMGSVQGTSLGISGLGNTSISDAQIPRVEFEFSHDGSSSLVLKLRSTELNGPDNFLLLNGFAIYPKIP